MAEYIERIEETCGDCIHADVCEINSLLTEFNRKNPAYCELFKNSADVVPVVRCKDCKNNPGLNTKTKDMIWCRKWQKEVRKTDFCSYGERKDGDTT